MHRKHILFFINELTSNEKRGIIKETKLRFHKQIGGELMTSSEKDTCTNLMNEAIKNARYSIDSYKRAEGQDYERLYNLAKEESYSK